MTPPDLTYPLVGLADSRPGQEAWEWFLDAEDFTICASYQLPDRPGMLIADGEGRCWRVSSVRDLGVAKGYGSLGERVMRFLFRNPLRRVDMTLDPVAAMTFADLQAHFCAAIQSNPDHSRDDEAIAGEHGPPRDEQDLLDEKKALVMRSNSVPELISNLWKEDLPPLLEELERTRSARPT